MSVRRNLCLVAAMVFLASLPFLGKGPRIDDPVYLTVAKRIATDPLRPYPVENVRSNGGFSVSNPPLQQYVLAGIISAMGENMTALHIVSAFFLLVAGLAMYGVARRFCAQPLAATALLIASPAVIPSQNLMLDIPVLALALVSVYLYLRGADEHKTQWAILGGVFLGLAFLTKFNALPLAPLFVIYAFVKRRYRCLVALLPALVIVGLWAVHDLAIYGVTQIASRQEASPVLEILSQPPVLLYRAVFTLSCLGASCFLPLFLVPRRSRQSLALVGLMIAASALPYLYALHQGRVTPIHVIVATGLLAMGMMMLVLIAGRSLACLRQPAAESSQRSDELFLIAWILGIVAFAIIFARSIAIRHFILALPPLIVLSCRVLEGTQAKAKRQAILTACCILTAGVGFAVARADYLHANVYEPLAKDVARTCAAEVRERKVFFLGAWEWAYWAEKNGLRRFPKLNAALQPGDLVAFPRTARLSRSAILEDQGAELVGAYVISSSWPVRTFDRNMAGYYAMQNFWETPYTISRAPIEEVRIVRCVRAGQLDDEQLAPVDVLGRKD